MNILVTGGSGLFGRKTVIHLLKDPEVSSVISMDVATPKKWFMRSIEKYDDKFHFVSGDVSELEEILNVMKAFSIQKLVHFAYLLGTDAESNPRRAVKVNVLGMCNAFEAARLSGVLRVVFASSESLYGTQDDYGDREVTEEDRLYPGNSFYSVSKRLSEVMASQYSEKYGMSMTGLRPTIGYGHGGRAPMLIKWLSDLVSLPAIGEPVSFEVDGLSLFSLVSADDVAALTRILLHAPSSRYPVYNTGGPPYSLRDVATQVRKYIPDAVIKFGNQPRRAMLPWKVSTARAKEEFGFSVMPLEKAVLIHINDAREEAGLEPIKG